MSEILLCIIVLIVIYLLRGVLFPVRSATQPAPQPANTVPEAKISPAQVQIKPVPLACDDNTGAPESTRARIALTYDAAMARYILKRSRDKQMYDAIAARTSDYYRPFFEDELKRGDETAWWNDVAYPEEQKTI